MQSNESYQMKIRNLQDGIMPFLPSTERLNINNLRREQESFSFTTKTKKTPTRGLERIDTKMNTVH